MYKRFLAKNLQIEEMDLCWTLTSNEMIQYIARDMTNLKRLALNARYAADMEALSHLQHTKFDLTIYCDHDTHRIFHLQNITQITLHERTDRTLPFEACLIAMAQNLVNLEIIKIYIDKPIIMHTLEQMIKHANKLSEFHRFGNIPDKFDDTVYNELVDVVLIHTPHKKLFATLRYFNWDDEYICNDWDKKLTIFNDHPSVTVHKYTKSQYLPRNDPDCCIA